MKVFEKLRHEWLSKRVAINVGLPFLEIERIVSEKKKIIPKEFQFYLHVVNGMQPGEYDEHLLHFFSLEEIMSETRNASTIAKPSDLLFAEFSVFSHVYLLRVDNANSSAMVIVSDGEHELNHSESFEDFVNEYLKDSYRVAYCWQ